MFVSTVYGICVCLFCVDAAASPLVLQFILYYKICNMNVGDLDFAF